MRGILALALCLTAVVAAPKNWQRIIGGEVTTIDHYPTVASLLYSWNSITYWQTCVGTILNTRSVLTTAHCVAGDATGRWRVRVGSTYANSGGVILNVNTITNYPRYDAKTYENDISIIRTTTAIVHNNNVMPATLAPTNYYLPDDEPLWAVGWGFVSDLGSRSEQIRRVQIQTLNQYFCMLLYSPYRLGVTDNMLCSVIDDGGKDLCQGDNGGPLFHRGIVVGLSSWSYGCAQSYYPNVNVRIARYASWINANSAV